MSGRDIPAIGPAERSVDLRRSLVSATCQAGRWATSAGLVFVGLATALRAGHHVAQLRAFAAEPTGFRTAQPAMTQREGK